MIRLRWQTGCEPKYMTQHSAAADLVARTELTLEPGQRGKVPTGVWIDAVEWASIPDGLIPELQIRSRSGLAFKHGIQLTNGVGTVDADYPEEICVLLSNTSDKTFHIAPGERVAQMAMNFVGRLTSLQADGTRTGGFGSTGF